MSYIGSSATPIPVAFSGVRTQSLSGTGLVSLFTLTRQVQAVTDIEVVVNNVQQSPFDGSYSIVNNGLGLQFSENPSAGTNNIYVVYRDQPLGSLNDPGAVKKTGDSMSGPLNIDHTVQGGEGLAILRAGANLSLNANYSAAGAKAQITSDLPLAISVAGNERMKVDTAGRVMMPYQPAFRAKFISSTQSGAAGYWVFDNVELNVGGGYNQANGRFTVPIAGRYLIIATAQHYGGVSTGGYVDVHQNGSMIRGMRMEWSNTSSFETRGVSGVFNAAANDYFQVYNGSGTSAHLDHCSFSGYLIG